MPICSIFRARAPRSKAHAPSKCLYFLGAICFLICGAEEGQAQHPPCFDANVVTHHYNQQRTGATLNETSLNQTLVSSPRFGKVAEFPVRGRIYAQPLFFSSLFSDPPRCVLIVATAENLVYAFDVINGFGKLIWTYDAGSQNVATAARVYLDADGTKHSQDITPTIGIIGTPVIDLPHFTMYFVAMTEEPGDVFEHTLHAIDIRTGTLRKKTSIVGNIRGGGQFHSHRENQRAALALVDDRVYIPWASFADIPPTDGLVMSYMVVDSTKPLQKVAQFQVASFDPLFGKRHKGGGIWQSGGGPAVDEKEFLYVVTGNGDSDNAHAGQDFDSSTVKLDTGLHVIDYYTPSYQNVLNANDLDLSVAGPMIPENRFDADGHLVKLLLHGSKAGFVYVLNRDNLGKFHEHENNIIQQLQVFPPADDLPHQMEPTHIHATPIFWKGPVGPRVYVASDYNLGVRAFQFDHEKLAPSPVATNFFPRAPISQMSLSSHGDERGTGVLWFISSPTGTVASYPGVLYAFNAETLDMLYSSETNPFDRLGDYARFNAPIVVAGLVYVPTFSNKLVVYGPCPGGDPVQCRLRCITPGCAGL